MLWLGVHLPNLGLEIFQQRQAQGPLRPAVLAEDGRVRLVDAQARNAGIAVGCTLATALSIAQDLIYFERDEAAENQRLGTLAAMTQGFSPLVSLASFALLLEVRGSLRLFGGLGALLAQLNRCVQRFGHVASIAAAHTPAAALALAKAGLATPLPDFPDCAELLRRARQALAAVPLACTEIDPRSIERLADMGINEVGPLARLPVPELGKRFGPGLVRELGKLTGAVADPRPPQPPEERFHTSLHLLESVSNKKELLLPMRRLAVALETWLAVRQLSVSVLSWRFKSLAGGALAVPVRFAKPRTQANAILEVSGLALERTDLPAEILTLTLAADSLAPVSQVRRDVQDLLQGTIAGGEAPAEFVDRIAARLGEDCLHRLCLVDDHRPECTSALTKASANMAGKGSGPRHAANARPLWLLEPPRPVRLQRYRILSGPERIEGGWWGRAVRRDYFVAEDGGGARCWLFRDLCSSAENGPARPSAEWFLHGHFA